MATEKYPSIRYFIDIHSFGEDILYSWGGDDDQTGDPTMNFHNPTYDGKRGILDSDPGGDPKHYHEYLPQADLDTLIALGNTIGDAIQAAHGRVYTVKSSANLYPTLRHL